MMVVVYVTDHAGQKVLTVGATGTATILAGKLKAASTLKPDGDNRMKGFAKYASTPDMKVVVSITLSGKTAEQARFRRSAARFRRMPPIEDFEFAGEAGVRASECTRRLQT